MKMWGANEQSGFSAPTIHFILSESLSHMCDTDEMGCLGPQEALGPMRDRDTQTAF